MAIATSDDNPPRLISVELDDVAYRRAGDAHFSGTSVRCSGRLIWEGCSFLLRDPHDFRLDTPD